LVLLLFQKYRLYLKRLSADASRQANLTAALGGRNPTYINMGLEAFKYYNAYGQYRPIPSTNHAQPNNLLARMNSPSAFGMHGLLPSQSLQIGHTQNNLSNSLGNVVGMNNSNLTRGANMSLQDNSKCFPTGPSGNSFSNISNATPLAPPNSLPLQSLEPINQQHLGWIHSSSVDPFNSFGESPPFPDLGRCKTTWPTAVSSSIQEPGQKNSMSQATLRMNAPKIEPLSNFTEPSSQIPFLGNAMQSQVAPLGSNALPMPFNQDTFTYGSSTNSRAMLSNNITVSKSGINTSLPNLRIDNSVVPRQTMEIGNAGGVPNMQGGRIDQQAVSNQLNYNNELMGTSRLQRGLSGGLDDIVVDMFRPV
jgi:two-component response regulator ARR-B family